MKICCISDLHGHLLPSPAFPKCDVLVIAGDICPSTVHSPFKQSEWVKQKFKKWLDGLKIPEIVGIAGNHDFIFERWGHTDIGLRWNYLQDSCVIIDHVKFYGFPWTPIFQDWAFNLPEDRMRKVVDDIPMDTNVLVTHGPPYRILDYSVLNDGKIVAVDTGCVPLREKVLQMPALKLHVFGHIHGGHGVQIIDGKTFANVSILDEFYAKVHKPILIEVILENSP